MNYQIVFDKAVRKQISNLPGHLKVIAKQKIAELSKQPRPANGKELDGHPHYYRMWIKGNYRLVWHIIEVEQIVEIEYIGPKTTDLYERLGLGRPE